MKYIQLSILCLVLTVLSTPLHAQSAYIANAGSNTVSVVDVASYSVTSTISVGASPVGVAVTPDETKAYISNSGAGTVSVINTASQSVTTTITVGNNPWGIAVHPDGSKVYVTNRGENTISVISVATNIVTATLTVGSGPYSLAFSPNGTVLYVSNHNDNTVSMVFLETNLPPATINVGTRPVGLISNRDGTRVYVANELSDNISVIDPIAQTVISTIPVGDGPFALALKESGAQLYVTNTTDNSISIINTSTNTNFMTIGGITRPRGIAPVPNTNTFYVTSLLGDYVYRFSSFDNSFFGSVLPVGLGPVSLGFFVQSPGLGSSPNLYPMFKGGTGQGYTAAQLENSNSIFFGGQGQGYAFQEIINLNLSIYTGGVGQGYTFQEFNTSNSIFRGGTGQGYALLETSTLAWFGDQDENWNNPLNWNKNRVPTSQDQVSITSGATHYPKLTAGSFRINDGSTGDYQCKGLIIEENAALSLNGTAKMVNKGVVEIGGQIEQYANQNGGILVTDGGTIHVKSTGTLSLVDPNDYYAFADLTINNGQLLVDTGVVEIADELEIINGSTITLQHGTIGAKMAGTGSAAAGFEIDGTSTANLIGEVKLGGQNSDPSTATIDWANTAIINADSASINFVRPLNPAAPVNKLYNNFGGHRVKEIIAKSTDFYIYPHFQDDVEILRKLEIGATDSVLQMGGTIILKGQFVNQGRFEATNGVFEFAGIDNVQVSGNQEFHTLNINKSNNAEVSILANPLKVKNLNLNQGNLNINEMLVKPDLQVSGDLNIANGQTLQFFGYQMEAEVGGNFYNNNIMPFMGGFQNFGLEGKFTFKSTPGDNFQIEAGNVEFWGDTVLFVGGGLYDILTTTNFNNTIVNIQSGKIRATNDTIQLSPFSLNDNYGDDKYIITGIDGAIAVLGVGGGEEILIPIGPSADKYTPLKIKNDGDFDNFTIAVEKGIKEDGNSGNPVLSKGVDLTWKVSEAMSGGSDVELVFEWKASDELADFDRTKAKVWHYKNGGWIAETSTQVTGTDPYRITAKNITSFSPFIVAEQSPLPVTCINFEAVPQKNKVRLQWETASEKNNQGFEIQRANTIAGRIGTFETIGFVAGNGSTSTRSSYHYLDEKVKDHEHYYYRLKQLDLDGQFAFACDIISTTTNADKATFKFEEIFPNPTSYSAAISIYSPKVQMVDWRIVNAIGQVLQHTTKQFSAGQQVVDLQIDAWPAGKYTLLLRLEDGNTIQRKFVKLP
ncbi:MAG: beta-propeller fold lactonase family protein [Saprospiraceae bacterium]